MTTARGGEPEKHDVSEAQTEQKPLLPFPEVEQKPFTPSASAALFQLLLYLDTSSELQFMSSLTTIIQCAKMHRVTFSTL